MTEFLKTFITVLLGTALFFALPAVVVLTLLIMFSGLPGFIAGWVGIALVTSAVYHLSQHYR